MRVNWNDPLSKNLLFAFPSVEVPTPSSAVIQDAVDGASSNALATKFTVTAGGVTTGNLPQGKGLVFTGGANAGVVSGALTTTIDHNLGMTYLVYASVASLPGAIRGILQIANAALTLGSWVTINASNLLAFTAKRATTNASFTAGTPPTGIPTLWIISWIAGSSPLWYANGQALTITVGSQGNGVSSKSATIQIGNATSQQFPGTIVAAAAWNRKLSVQEILDLSANPWRFYLGRPRRSLTAFASGAAGTFPPVPESPWNKSQIQALMVQ